MNSSYLNILNANPINQVINVEEVNSNNWSNNSSRYVPPWIQHGQNNQQKQNNMQFPPPPPVYNGSNVPYYRPRIAYQPQGNKTIHQILLEDNFSYKSSNLDYLSVENTLPIPVVDLTKKINKKKDEETGNKKKIEINIEELEEGEEIVDKSLLKRSKTRERSTDIPRNEDEPKIKSNHHRHHHHHHHHHSRKHQETSKPRQSLKFSNKQSSSSLSDSPSQLQPLLKFTQDEQTLAQCTKAINPTDNSISFTVVEKNISKQIINYNVGGPNSKSLLTQEKNLVQCKLIEFFKPEIEEKETQKEDETPQQQEPQSVTRYYYSNPEIHCRRCKEPGHYEAFCSYPPVVKCYYCLGAHTESQCQNYLCFVCSEYGHKNINCPRGREPKCIRCNRAHKERCGKLWVQNNWKRKNEILKDKDKIKCIICGWENHINCGTLQIDDLYEKKKQNENEDFIFEEVN